MSLLLRKLQKLSLLRVHLLPIKPVLPLDEHVLIVVEQIARIVQAPPLDDAVALELRHALRVEHVAGRSERLAPFRGVDVLDQGREQQDHVAAFVHDGGAAVRTRHFAGQVVRGGLGGRVVPAEVVVAVCEVDVGFVEDGGPLEGCLSSC